MKRRRGEGETKQDGQVGVDYYYSLEQAAAAAAQVHCSSGEMADARASRACQGLPDLVLVPAPSRGWLA